jgi:uncharacterized damage-inducible protein DinB
LSKILPGTMKTLNFITCIFVMISLSTTVAGQSPFLEDYKLKWKNAMEYTLEFAQVMPEDFYGYTPTKIEMTYGEQLKHVAGNIVWLCSSYLQGTKTTIDPLKAGNSKREITAVLESSFNYANKTISALTESDLNETVDFFAGKMTRRRILFLLTDHVTHHRGQLVVYLRMKNIEPPSYRGWS